jgi:serine acetyltransferase
MSIVCEGARIGDGARLEARSFVGPESVLGNGVKVLYAAQIYWKVRVGARSIVGGFCCDRALIGKRAIMLGAMVHKMLGEVRDWDTAEEPSPVVEDGAKVGMGALLIGSIRVGRGAFVGGGAVVTKNVPAGRMWIGSGVVRRRSTGSR